MGSRRLVKMHLKVGTVVQLLGFAILFHAITTAAGNASGDGASGFRSCAGLRPVALTNMQVNSASEVVGSLPESPLAPSLQPNNAASRDLPRFCRVIATVATSANSAIRVEIWLPEEWNGKLLGLGNTHGFGGEFEHDDMAMGLRRGYAVATSDAGLGEAVPYAAFAPPARNAQIAAANPASVEDFAWRATHEMTVVAKVMIQMRYGAPAHLSYFDGCSNGGRQAMREAQQFPADYDGVIVGSAGLYWTRFMASNLWQYTQLTAANMTEAKLTLARDAAVAACDRIDGIVDQVIADPRQCHWQPSALLCPPVAASNACLTKGEVNAIERLERPLTDPTTGKTMYGGWYPGGELLWASGNLHALLGAPAAHFRYIVARDPRWAPADANVFALLDLSERPGAPSLKINTVNPDLSGFQKRRGKLIQYHGWNDQGMPPSFYPEFYREVVNRQKGWDKLARTQKFYRLFMVPGMGHCGGGDGPVNFGALTQPPSPTLDADHDVLEALDRWVIRDVAPDTIIATQFASAKREQRQMPLCPYPKSAVYASGDVASPYSYRCDAKRAPRKR